MITLRTGSHALNIITLLSVTGEFPMRSLKLLGNERVLKALVHKMTTPQDYRLPHTQTEERITCKLLNVSGKGSSKSIRFSKAALPILEWIHPDAYDYYMHSFWDHKFPGDAAHIERNHRVAESVMMCMAAGIECRPYSLPSLQNMQISLTVPEYSAYYLAIVQIGYIGLCKAAYTDKGGCFSTYAYRLIWHEISDALIRANRLGDREILLSTYNYEAQEDAHFSSFSESLEIENAISNAETSATEIIQKGIQALRMSTDGYNSYEIGEVLHTSPGKVRVWMSRARKYLKSQPEIVRLAGTYDIG